MSTSITSSTLGKRTYKIVFLGDSGTGKTSIIERFVNNKFEDKENPTIGIDFLGKNMSHKGTTCRLQLWDTAGQQRFRSLIPTYLKDAICAVFVFDVNNPLTLSNVEHWIEMFRQNKGEKTVSIICGNKSDLQMSCDKKQLEKLMDKHRMPYFSVSAKSGNYIDEIFIAVLDLINEMNKSFMKNKNKSQSTEQSDTDQQPATQKPFAIPTKTDQNQNQQNIEIGKEDPSKKKKRFLCC